MKKYRSLLFGALWLPIVSSAITLLLVVTSYASKPGGGGGGGGGSGPVPPGNIYYSVYLSGGQQAYSMKADGTQKTALGINTGSPSGLLHGAARWFLQIRVLSGQTNLSGSTRSEVFAVREDGTGSVQLTDDPSLGISLDWTPVETTSDALVAGVARRWNFDGTVNASSIGVYVATLRFDAAGNVIGLDGAPAFLVSVGVVPHPSSGTPVADYSRFSFSPDMTRIVVDHYQYGAGLPGLRFVDVTTGAETPFVAGPAREPAWSPDGTKIAFRLPDLSGRGDSIEFISPNGTGRTTAFKAVSDSLYSPMWAPDSTAVAFVYQSAAFFTTDIYRKTLAAASAVNLTTDVPQNIGLRGWR